MTRLFDSNANLPEIKANVQKWVLELREPGLLQTTGVLCREEPDEYYGLGECCLGVACRILNVPFEIVRGVRSYETMREALPELRADQLGLIDNEGSIYYQEAEYEPSRSTSLAELNDGGSGFFEIAETIQEHWDRQFGSLFDEVTP